MYVYKAKCILYPVICIYVCTYIHQIGITTLYICLIPTRTHTHTHASQVRNGINHIISKNVCCHGSAYIYTCVHMFIFSIKL